MPKVTYTPTKGLVQEAGSGVSITGNVISNYVRFVTGDYFGLSLSTSNDAAADAGLTLSHDTLHEVAWVGDAGSAIVLPKASAGKLVVLRFTGQADGGSTMTITTGTGDIFAAQSLNTDVVNLGDGLSVHNRVIATDTVQTIATGGGAIVSANGTTHNRFSIAATATNNQSNIGAELSFFCNADGEWRMAWLASELGTGALNATFAFSAV